MRLALVGALLVSSEMAQAQATTYTDRTAFLAATTGTTTIDFEGIAPDGDYTSTPRLPA